MKKQFVVTVAVILVIATLFPGTVFAMQPGNPDEPNYNNTMYTSTYVTKLNGEIYVEAHFEGYSQYVTWATIQVEIKEYLPDTGWTTYPGSSFTQFYFTYYGDMTRSFPIDTSLFYRVTVKYTIRGTGGDGEPDVITYNKIIAF